MHWCVYKKPGGQVIQASNNNVPPGTPGALPQDTATRGYRELTPTEFAQYAKGDKHPYGGPKRWAIIDGSFVEIPDTRPYLVITNATGLTVDEGTSVTLNLQVFDSNDQPLSITAAREFTVEHNNTERRVKISVTNGQKQLIRVFEPGVWIIRSSSPFQYYVKGDTRLTVNEVWG